MWPGRPVAYNGSNISRSNKSSSRDSGLDAMADTLDDKTATHHHDSTTAVTNGSASALATTNASSMVATAAQLLPSSCTVLIVDRRFLTGVYHTTGNGGPTMRTGPAKDDVVFVQELLEIYGQGKYTRTAAAAAAAADAGRFLDLVAVVSGDTALRWIFNHTGNKAIIVLIDIDETFDLGNFDGHADNKHSSNSSDSTLYGPIYTPPTSQQNQQTGAADSCGSEGSGPYGLALLRVIAHYVAIGVFRNVAPIAKRVRNGQTSKDVVTMCRLAISAQEDSPRDPEPYPIGSAHFFPAANPICPLALLLRFPPALGRTMKPLCQCLLAAEVHSDFVDLPCAPQLQANWHSSFATLSKEALPAVHVQALWLVRLTLIECGFLIIALCLLELDGECGAGTVVSETGRGRCLLLSVITDTRYCLSVRYPFCAFVGTPKSRRRSTLAHAEPQLTRCTSVEHASDKRPSKARVAGRGSPACHTINFNLCFFRPVSCRRAGARMRRVAPPL
ncbi:hypothetical protein COEREDRAFT_6575 [Coemansia reversa NRRL 1564]|uniref:Uncharacterized protein n=1 Tax=Coemansia reversa (strain ATCC 12441 / NRRL 1564) TaxID=763665 RepID=A0A2G5BH43_COERN|nr:hypothetical protein COEREDRAFT_6575 [Coemansia reversa NRRL 1564]|eukprot:PIA18336.1 hypothetical protein COEREDRAFT_6575 [Coemansia reversa NRRL 1564]